eukprot:TRINITY_DN5703_c0_g2_i5.p1 TRINITY_DN5703_c0_g2~~TRINITY_DN5703_c0_g2_i5.p1  ORF type:complete len:238 (+),score=39.09 TRINITY_DN5703_c0_g2_i5:89-802(+)
MAPRSAVVIQHKGATIYINNEELLKSVVVALGLAPCDSAGHSLAKSSTASASDAEMFEIFSDKSVENAEQGVQACQALPLMLDAQTQTDVSPDLECVESSCDAEVQVDGHASAPLVRMVAEAQTQTSSSVVEAGSQTSEDVFDSEDVMKLLDIKVTPIQDQIKVMSDALVESNSRCAFLQDSVKTLNEQLDSAQCSSVRVLWADCSAEESLPDAVVEVAGSNKKGKKVHRQSRVRAS